jgi:hypothetical protein
MNIMLTKERLEKAQKDLSIKINMRAKELGLSNERILPVTDGVACIPDYLEASHRVMWVLKEPWEKEENGKLRGGWDIWDAWEDIEKPWRIPTWKRMIYISHGILNGKTWFEMDDIRDDPKMQEVLNKIAYINISKMPANTTTNYKDLQAHYKIWRDILMEQIHVYTPDIIIFGNTFDFFKEDLVGKDTEPNIREDGFIHVYKKGNTKYFDAYHPNNRIKGMTDELYVNTIIKPYLDIPLDLHKNI